MMSNIEKDLTFSFHNRFLCKIWLNLMESLQELKKRVSPDVQYMIVLFRFSACAREIIEYQILTRQFPHPRLYILYKSSPAGFFHTKFGNSSKKGNQCW